MTTTELKREIGRLPLGKRLQLIEQTLKSIRKNEHDNKLSRAAALLESDYKFDAELTEFTAIDLDRFYETR